MTVINTNIKALYTQSALKVSERDSAVAMQQLATGKRINSSKDDAAGLAIAARMTQNIKGLNQAIRNAGDAISLIQVAEGATNEITSMLQRMSELAVQSSNSTYSSEQRGYLDQEFQQLKQEIVQIAETTEWNGIPLLNSTGTTKTSTKLNELNLPDFLKENQSITINGLTFFAKKNISKYEILMAFESLPSSGLSSVVAQSIYDSKIGANNSSGVFSGNFNSGYSTSISNNGVIEFSSEPLTIYSNFNYSGPLNGTSLQPPIFKHYVTPTVAEEVILTEGSYSFEIVKDSRWQNDGSYLTALGTVTKADGSVQPFVGRYNSFMGSIIFSDGKFDYGSNDKVTTSFDDYLNVGKFAPSSYISLGQKFQFTVTKKNRAPISIITNPSDAMVNKIKSKSLTLSFQVGPKADQTITFETQNFGKNGDITGTITSEQTQTNILSVESANNVVAKVNSSLDKISTSRASMGAVMNRLEHVIDNLTNVVTNSEASRSQIEDADYSQASTELAKTQIKQQAATAVLAQANLSSQMVLKLLEQN